MAAALWRRVAAWAAPLLLAPAIFAQLDAEPCFRLYYGAGTTRSLPRARACFEKEVPQRTCNQTPFHLDRLYLAVMYLDAQGGAADLEKARALLSECFNDSDIAELRKRIAARESAPPGQAGKLDFCASLAGTTRAGISCSSLASLRIDPALAALENSVLTRLDVQGRVLYRKWKEAGDKFAEADAGAVFESISPGTLAPAASNDRVNEIHAQRLQDLRELFRYRVHPQNNAAALAEAVHTLEARYRQQLDREDRAKVRESAQKAREAWIAYRDATPAFYCEALKARDCGAMATDVFTILTRRRIDDLTPKH
ncbi:MAG: hypothetical protein ABSH44_21400 [Bryobacteraceae bacterium]|jgi:hypothetical protein